MRLNNREYFFDRCLKFVFVGPKLTITETDKNGNTITRRAPLTIEYCPRKDERLCPRLEADIKDMPSPNKKDRPGYSAVLKIYNPGADILNMVANSVNWVADYIARNANGEPQATELSGNSLKKYYDNKMMVAVYAGYYSETMKDGDYGDAPIMNGYVNNTYYYRKGNDNILVLYCHDIDMAQSSASITDYGALAAKEKYLTLVSEQENERKGKATFDATFKSLVENFEKGLDLRVSLLDRISGDTERFRVLYVGSPQAYYSAVRDNPNVGTEVEKPELAAACKDSSSFPTSGFYTTRERIEEMLEDLCNYGGYNLAWQLDTIYARIPTYIVFYKGSSIQAELPDKGIVKIWNFQNLMEMPVIDGTGSLSVKMFFNRKCLPWAYLELKVTTDVVDEDFANFTQMGMLENGGKIVGGFAGQAQNPAIQTTQLSGSSSIGAVNDINKRGKDYGYLYNKPYLIISTQHRLTTHGTEWTTSVHTTPLLRGALANEARKNTR